MNKKKYRQMAEALAFGREKEQKKVFSQIRKLAEKNSIYLASTHNFYLSRSKKQLPLDFTVPAVNLRGMVFDMARAVFRTALKIDCRALIFELARSEMGYTGQTPEEYCGVVMAAGLAEGFIGPLFIQGDHFQVKTKAPGLPENGEITGLKKLIKRSIKAGFYNLDIDCSTLVDYSRKKINNQQKPNYKYSALLADFARKNQPANTILSLGGEIGHIGGKNSTEEELHAYMAGFNRLLKKKPGLSKISIQTGTHHGGIVLADGSLAKIDIDFAILKKLARAARKYQMGGTVQHGASTLPENLFAKFPKSEAIEVHLATGFQNIIMDHSIFPKKLLKKMYSWLEKNKKEEWKDGQTAEQFYYKLRKKAWGEFKKEVWTLDEKIKNPIRKALEKNFTFIFKQLNVAKTRKMVEKITHQKNI